MTGKIRKNRTLQLESLEHRLCMAASVGWDGPGQGSAELTYYISSVPSGMDLSQSAVESALESALDAWTSVADITFTQTQLPNQPDSIDFEFRSIDGSGGILAQAYLPDDVNREPVAGNVRFDTAELWEIGNSLGRAAFDLVQVAVHEIGHALGLDHSRVSGSVMTSSVSATQSFGGLAPTDVDAILALYAPASGQSTPDPFDPQDEPAANPAPGSNDQGGSETPRFVPWGHRHRSFFGFHNPRIFIGAGRTGGQPTSTSTASVTDSLRLNHFGGRIVQLNGGQSLAASLDFIFSQWQHDRFQW